MHRSTLVALVAVACGGCIPAQAADPATPGKPNVILCMTDDQGWGDTGYNGHPVLKTPELDAMAAAGIRFDRFFTAHPMCSPTRASCLTGRSPTRYRCMTWGHDLPLAEVTIAEAVRTAGYATGHFGKWHLGGIPEATGGTGQGLPESFDAAPRHPGNQGFDEWYSNGNTFDLGSAILYHGEERLVLPEKDTSDAVMDLALEWIGRQAEAGKPFLAVIWFSAPHGPHKAAPEYAAAYATAKKQADYLGELAGVDHAMGRLRRGLREMKVADDTMLWFCSDNGAGPGGSTGGLPGAKKFLSEGGNRVPGILEWPARIRRPFATTIPASTLDIYPTVLDVLGITMADEVGPVDGISLVPLIAGTMETRPRPIPLVNGGHVRLVDGEYRLQGDRLLRFDEAAKAEVDVTDAEPETHARLSAVRDEFLASVKVDQAKYAAPRKRR